MPDRSKVRWSQLKVGVVSLVAFIILFVLVFLLTSSKAGLFNQYVMLRTYMEDASGIADGSMVRLNGYTIGYLDKLQLAPGEHDRRRAVEFVMLVEEKYLKDIPVDSIVAITNSNVLGDKFLNITKGQASQTVQPNAELKSQQGQDIPELMAQMGNVLGSFQTIVTRVDNLLAGVEAGKGNIGLLLKDDEFYNRLNALASEGQKMLADIRTSNGTLSKVIHSDELYQEVRAPLKRIDAILADIQGGQGNVGLLLKDRALYDEFKTSMQQFNSLLADLQAGKGSAGQLLKSDELHKRVDELLVKFNGLADKINAGQGTVGQLMVNPQLYDALSGATREFQSLAKDVRANPKKFLSIRLAFF